MDLIYQLASLFGVGIAIAWFSNNPLEEWVENSIWGNDGSKLKKSYEQDVKDYTTALQKMGG